MSTRAFRNGWSIRGWATGPTSSMGSVYYKLSDEESQKFMLKVPLGTGEPAADAGNT